jgi:hypothetical protein
MMETDSGADLLFVQGEADDPQIVRGAGDRELWIWRDGGLSTASSIDEDPG